MNRFKPGGVMPRHRASSIYPVQVPDLIGAKGRKYLDRTYLQQHPPIVDMMRYAALNQGADQLASFDGFIPFGGPEFNKLRDPASPIVGGRYSDEQLYALSLHVSSLKPSPNPNNMGEFRPSHSSRKTAIIAPDHHTSANLIDPPFRV
jgi:hypothetical protein